MTPINAPSIRCVADAIDAKVYEIDVFGIPYLVCAHCREDAEATAEEAHFKLDHELANDLDQQREKTLPLL